MLPLREVANGELDGRISQVYVPFSMSDLTLYKENIPSKFIERFNHLTLTYDLTQSNLDCSLPLLYCR